MSDTITIKDVRTYAISKEGGGDYHLQEKGHWITDTYIANPMSMYPKYKKTRAVSATFNGAIDNGREVICILKDLLI